MGQRGRSAAFGRFCPDLLLLDTNGGKLARSPWLHKPAMFPMIHPAATEPHGPTRASG